MHILLWTSQPTQVSDDQKDEGPEPTEGKEQPTEGSSGMPVGKETPMPIYRALTIVAIVSKFHIENVRHFVSAILARTVFK